MSAIVSTRSIAAPEDVLAFWFNGRIKTEVDALDCARRWFFGRRAFDDEVHARFLMTIEAALSGNLEAWAETVRGRLALILVLDQLTRNAFRGYAKAWAGDRRALALALEALDRGLDAEMSWIERVFLTIPLLHSENAAHVARNVALAREALANAPVALRPLAEAGLEQALKYEAVLARFGRYPFRNVALGRETTPDEREFLATFRAAPGLVRPAAA